MCIGNCNHNVRTSTTSMRRFHKIPDDKTRLKSAKVAVKLLTKAREEIFPDELSFSQLAGLPGATRKRIIDLHAEISKFRLEMIGLTTVLKEKIDKDDD